VTTPTSGTIYHLQAGLAIFNPCTKFEVSTFTCYEDMKFKAKCRNYGGLGWLGSLKVIGNVAIR